MYQKDGYDYRCPLMVPDFDLNKRKFVRKRKCIELWVMKDLPAGMILIGRTEMKQLRLEVYRTSDIKYALYSKLKELDVSWCSMSDEESNNLWRRLACGYSGPPGIYKMTRKGALVRLDEEGEPVRSAIEDERQVNMIERRASDTAWSATIQMGGSNHQSNRDILDTVSRLCEDVTDGRWEIDATLNASVIGGTNAMETG
eukprot:354332_1